MLSTTEKRPAPRRYQIPRLTRHQQLKAVSASVVKLISGFETPGDDAPECWVARAVYGVGDARWLLFRDWLRGGAPAWLRRGYLRHGPRLGPVVARSALLQGLLRPLMNRAIRARFGI